MNKEKGTIPILLIVQILIIIVAIAFVVALAQFILKALSYIPGAGWLGDLIPEALGTILRSFMDLAEWSLQGNFIGKDKTVTGLAQQAGWTMVRDLANIVLVLGLIIIALGIILGIREYEAKKALPILIVIALLINFTPVICGWIIDFSNKIIGWLLGGAIPSDQFVKVIETEWKNLKLGKSFIQTFVFTLFVIIAVVVYLLYFFLFMIRYVMLLILVIFSPIAFAGKVFPPSEKIKKFFPSFLYWDQWWMTFLEWCTIGIFGAFILSIANNLMATAELTKVTKPSILGEILIYFFPILLLLIGFFATLEAAKGAVSLMPGMAQALGVIAGVAGGALKLTGKKVSEAIPEKARRAGERWAASRAWGSQYGRGEAGWKGWGKRRVGETAMALSSPLWIGKRAFGKALSAGMMTEMADADQAAKKVAGTTAEQKNIALAEAAGPLGTRGDRVGTLAQAIRERQLDDMLMLRLAGKTPEEQKKEKAKFEKEIKATMGEAAMFSRGYFMEIARYDPVLANKALEQISGTKYGPEIIERMGLTLTEDEKNEIEKRRRELYKKGEDKKRTIEGKKSELRKPGITDEEKTKLEEEIEQLEKEKEKLETWRFNMMPYGRKIIKLTRAEHVDTMRSDLILHPEKFPDLEDEMHHSWGLYHFVEEAKRFGPAAVKPFMNTAKEEKGSFWYAVNNPVMLTGLTSIFAPESGLFAPEGIKTAEALRWIEKLNQFNPEQMKKLSDSIDQLTIAIRRDLTECLKTNANRIEGLRDKDAGDIIRKVEEWRKQDSGKEEKEEKEKPGKGK